MQGPKLLSCSASRPGKGTTSVLSGQKEGLSDKNVKYLTAQYVKRWSAAGSRSAGINFAYLVLTSGTRSKTRKEPLILVPFADHL